MAGLLGLAEKPLTFFSKQKREKALIHENTTALPTKNKMEKKAPFKRFQPSYSWRMGSVTQKSKNTLQ